MILVTGASGFIGRHLVRALAQDGREVRALVRSDEAAARVREMGAVGGARGDLEDAESLKAAAAGCDLVFHLAGSYRGSAATMHSSHVAGTARLLRAVEPTARFVLVSSTSVYGWDQNWPADHATLPRPASAYGSAKLAAERLVLARTTGESVVVRPTITYGTGDDHGMLARTYRLFRKGVRRFPGTGENRIHLTHVDDLVAGLQLVAVKGDGIYLLAGPTAEPVRHLFALLAEGAGLPAPRFGLPAGLLRPVAKGVDAAWAAAGRKGEAPLSRHSVDVLTRDRAYRATRAEDELGWTPAITVEEGVPEVGAWLASISGATASTKTRSPAQAEPGRPSAAAVASGNATTGSENELGFDWRGYVADPDEGLGTVYERFALRDVLQAAVGRTGSQSVLHAPLFGMMGFPGLDAAFLAQEGMRVGLLDFSEARLEAVRAQWEEFGLTPELHLVDSPDPASWPDRLSAEYDLVFSFAALWWFDDPWAVLAAQTRWAGRGVLSCVPNMNVFLKMRARLWHQGLFDKLNEEALDRQAQLAAGQKLGLSAVDSGLFDIPPFPDTSVPLAKVVRAVLGKKDAPAPVATTVGPRGEGEPGEGAWSWSILPYLKGEQPDLEERVAKLAAWERYVPKSVAPGLAHHRYTLFIPTEVPTGR
ncbi:MAG: NAD-dependent epimerase/dehydratase family protein [Acidimicrobiales bacterium]